MEEKLSKEVGFYLEELKNLAEAEREAKDLVAIANKAYRAGNISLHNEYMRRAKDMEKRADEIRNRLKSFLEKNPEIEEEVREVIYPKLWEEATPAERDLLRLSKYRIKCGDTKYFADHITLDNGYVRFVPKGKFEKGIGYVIPTEKLKEMWVRADVIEDPVFTGGADLTEILLALVPIAAMFLLLRIMR